MTNIKKDNSGFELIIWPAIIMIIFFMGVALFSIYAHGFYFKSTVDRFAATICEDKNMTLKTVTTEMGINEDRESLKVYCQSHNTNLIDNSVFIV